MKTLKFLLKDYWISRTLRYRRDSRLLAANIAGRGVCVPNVPDGMVYPLGNRVVRSPDWKCDDQGSNMEGTVISLVDNRKFLFWL